MAVLSDRFAALKAFGFIARSVILLGIVLNLVLNLATPVLAQSTGGRIFGRVTDPTSAVVPGVKVTLVNEESGVARSAQTDASGDYAFPAIPVGLYRLEFDLAGFKKNVRRGVQLELNQALALNMVLQLGAAQEVVDVTSEAPLVDTSSTQLGAIVNSRAVSELPLNARDAYQLLSLQPGVQSTTGTDLYYGSDRAGAVSVNGGRGRGNNFSVNGGDANDQFANLPTVQPSPDAIEEFRVLTNTFDAEYGRSSGAVVNVVTKSGTNQFHGNVYEYFRNTVLDSRGYFDTSKSPFNQNQFGGTFGGPITKNRSFFFLSYEGRRIRQGVSGPVTSVPTSAERTGDFSNNFSAPGAFGGQVSDQLVADVLNTRTGCAAAISAAEGTTPAPGVAWAQIFPNNQIPSACQDPVAANLLRYVPTGNISDGSYQAVLKSRTRADQLTAKWDFKLNDRQNLSAYYYFVDDDVFQPFSNFQAAGANVSGFGGLAADRFQQINLSHTWTISNNLVNEARAVYMREAQKTFNHPEKTAPVTDSCTGDAAAFCFNGTGDSAAVQQQFGTSPKLGITPGLGAGREGVPFINIAGGFVIGNNFEGELPQIGNSYSLADELTFVRSKHTMKFGADVRELRFDQTLYFNVAGNFGYTGNGPNSVQSTNNYPNYLLGLPDSYSQGSAQVENVRSKQIGLFAQDSWKFRPNITVNYGLRWELFTPLTDTAQHVQSFRPGQNSSIFPCQLSAASQASLGTSDCTPYLPTGLVVPGDKGVPAGLTSTDHKAFAPRIGIAYSPGASGKTSIRAGFGIFYSPIEQLVLEQFSAEPPFGGSTFLSNPLFNTPFVQQSGSSVPNPFNGILNPKRGQPVDWSTFRPILLYGEFQPHLKTQYSEQYNVTFQQELSRNLVLQVGFVGSQAHHLLASHDLNSGNAQTCLDLQSISVATSDPSLACGPFFADNSFFISPGTVLPNDLHLPYANHNQVLAKGTVVGANGVTLVGLRPYASPNCDPLNGAATCPADGVDVLSNIFAEDTVANSAYNSLQTSLEKRFSHGLQAQVAYTWSKSIDQASSFEESLNPFNPRATRSLSLFDSRHRFVVNGYWDLPIPKHNGAAGVALNGWSISTILTVQTGFPIRLSDANDQELVSSFFFTPVSTPNQIAPLKILNPRTNRNAYFDAASFVDPALGTFGNAPRSICCGPGIQNVDVTFAKTTPWGGDKRRMEFRADLFNLFNHTQFQSPDGAFSDGSDFGKIKRARDPRLAQFALKIFF